MSQALLTPKLLRLNCKFFEKCNRTYCTNMIMANNSLPPLNTPSTSVMEEKPSPSSLSNLISARHCLPNALPVLGHQPFCQALLLA